MQLLSVYSVWSATSQVPPVASSAVAGLVTVWVALALAVAGGAIAIVLAVRAHERRNLVVAASAALRELRALNARSQVNVVNHGQINHTFRYQAMSKSKFDRFDLARFMAASLLEHESYFEREVRARTHALGAYGVYRASAERLAQELLGHSSHSKVEQPRFVEIERKLFAKHLLSRPNPAARVIARVAYTSPKGQNSYSRGLTWDFSSLQRGLASAQEVRSRQSTAAAMRARERSLMTLTVRSDILRRDGYRCRMCGASASDGVELHVDHILPVSKGGRTIAGNLQTLCQPCNLGKGNRFVG